MSVKCKTFDIYLKEMIYHPERASKWLKDKRLTISEKTILSAHLLIRNNKNPEAIDEILKVGKSDIDFVEDHRNLLLGICYNNIGKYLTGEKHLLLAQLGFKSRSDNYHLFTTIYNLIINYSNLGRISDISHLLNQMENMRFDSKLQEYRLLRCQCIYALDTNNKNKFREYSSKIKKLKSEMPESELGPQLISEFMFHMQNEDIDSADMVREEMKNFRKFSLSENYNFIKTLLSYLKNDSTIYAYDKMFSNPSSCLYYQMKVIESFQIGSIDEATHYWNKLREEHSRELYQDDFKWTGEKCLFSLCLDKNLKLLSVEQPVLEFDSSIPKYKIIYELLLKSSMPVKAEALYEAVYGESYSDKDDLKKLSKLIISIREKYQVEIVSKKGTYQIKSQKLKNIQNS